MKTRISIITMMIVLLTACNTSPEPIAYGTDACHFCKMNIVSKTHAAQAVSSKGKQFKYDAIECLVNDINKNPDTEMSVILVADYLNAGNMLHAEEAHYIISQNIPSPMGANLSAVANIQQAEELKNEQGGELFDWQSLKNRNNEPHSGHHH